LNLLEDFSKGISIKEYLGKLDEQKQIHELHYRKAGIDQFQLQIISTLKILVITEPWCSDSSAILPVLLRFLEVYPVEFRIALRDQNPGLIDRFLTNGGRAIPIFLFLDESGNLIMKFGPRPLKAQAIFEQYRQDIAEGKIQKQDVIKKIRTFYAKDRGNAILEEFVQDYQQSVNHFKGIKQ